MSLDEVGCPAGSKRGPWPWVPRNRQGQKALRDRGLHQGSATGRFGNVRGF